jgi:hypothetical protein
MAARFDMEKPIMSPEQMAGHTQMWAEDNVSRYPYLLANLLRDTDGNPIAGSNGPIAYTKAPNVPPAMAALIQVADAALSDLLGNQQAGEQLQPNQSGKAVELIQNRLDMQVFIYMSNMAKFKKRVGEVWLSMARDVLIEDERQMKTVGTDGQMDTVTLRTPIIDEETGEQTLENDPAEARFDVWVDVGPSSQSRRAATVRALTGMAQLTDDPQDRKVLTSTALMNIEGEGLQDVRDYYRKQMVQMGVIKPTEEEQAEMQAAAQGQTPDPQAQYLLAAAEQATADAALKRAGTVEKVANADLLKAKTAGEYAAAMQGAHAQQIASVQALHEMLNPPVYKPRV